MKKSLLFVAILGLSTTSMASQIMPSSALYGGLGVSGVSTNFGDIKLSNLGVSTVYNNGVLVSSGTAGGSYNLQTDPQNKIAPLLQLGYFQHFINYDWLWGAKLTYSYLNSSNTSSEFTIPQFITNPAGNAFAGTVTVASLQSSNLQQIILTPLFGRAFDRGFIYLGAGPSVALTETKIKGVTGYQNIDGTIVNVSGMPTNFSSTDWVYGAAAVLGGTYFIECSLFLDFSYNFNWTINHTEHFDALSTSLQPPYSSSASLTGSSKGQVLTQTVTLSINKLF